MCVIVSDAIWMGQLVSTDNDAGQDIEPVDIPNDSKELVTTSIKPYVENSNTNAHIHLGDTCTLGTTFSRFPHSFRRITNYNKNVSE